MPVHMARVALNATSAVMHDNSEGVAGESEANVVDAIVLSSEDICGGRLELLYCFGDELVTADYLYVAHDIGPLDFRARPNKDSPE